MDQDLEAYTRWIWQDTWRQIWPALTLYSLALAAYWIFVG